MNIKVGSLCQFVVNSNEKLIMATKDENVLDEGVKKESVSPRRWSSYRENTLHKQYTVCKVHKEVRDSYTWDWLERGTLKKETEGLLTAAQDQALWTYIRNMINKQDVSLMCHLMVKGRKLSAI